MDLMKLFCLGAVLSSITAISSSSQHLGRHDDCLQSGVSLTCDHDIPDQIPHGVTDVFIKDFNKPWSEHSHVLHDQIWTSVTKFDIIINPKGSWDLSGTNLNSNLDRLKNLKTLGIHGSNIYMRPNSLMGLDNVTHLDLANCQSLSENDIVQILSGNQTLPNLKHLNLAMLYSSYGDYIILSRRFMDLLQIKSIEMLSLSGTNIAIDDLKQLQRNFSLAYLDLSNVTIAITDRLNSVLGCGRLFLANVKTVNVSDIPIRSLYKNNNKQLLNINETEYCRKSPFSANLEHVYANNINLNMILMDNSSITLSPRCKMKQLKTLHLRGNNIRKLNGTIIWQQDTEIAEIDISSNGMVYLSPKILGELQYLRNFYISNNSLFEMESLKEFNNLLRTFFLLEHLNMAYNKLTIIPYGMFIHNGQLKILDMMGNRLQSITFKLEHLKQLQVLDLRQNKILYLKGEGLLQVQSLLHPEKNGNSSKIDIRFKGNPLKCSCESLEFIKWLDMFLQPYTHTLYQCQFENDVIDVDTEAVEKSNYLCHRDGIISAASVSVIIVAFIITGGIARRIYMVRKGKRMNETEIFLNDLKKGCLGEKYLVFLSHSNDDGDLVMQYVFHQLDNTLKHMVGPGYDKEIICTGDINFRPGVSLINEIMRCVSESLVMIFVISRSFCKSAWCRMELKEAYQQEKPIILVFKEQVNLEIMPQYLRNIFQRYARAKLVKVNGQIEVIPKWKTLCDSVLFLASRQQQTLDAENKS